MAMFKKALNFNQCSLRITKLGLQVLNTSLSLKEISLAISEQLNYWQTFNLTMKCMWKFLSVKWLIVVTYYILELHNFTHGFYIRKSLFWAKQHNEESVILIQKLFQMLQCCTWFKQTKGIFVKYLPQVQVILWESLHMFHLLYSSTGL